MAYISKHNSKEEGKGDTCEYSGVVFFVGGYPISINNELERSSELIGSEVGGWLNF